MLKIKRDLDLIRRIMLQIEAFDSTSLTAADFKNLCSNKYSLYYNIHMMYQAGLIDAVDIRRYDNVFPQYQIKCLSNSGCEYLDTIRNGFVWRKTKTSLKPVGGAASLEVVQEIARKILAKHLETH